MAIRPEKINKKESVGNVLSLVPRIEALASPIQSKRATPKTLRRCMYIIRLLPCAGRRQGITVAVYNIHPEGIHRCFVFDWIRNCQISMRQNQSVSKRLLKYVRSLTTPNRRSDGTGQIYKVSLRRERNRPKERRLSLENFINKPSFPSLGSRPKTTYRIDQKLLTK